jgi:uridine monophosphate synthetase
MSAIAKDPRPIQKELSRLLYDIGAVRFGEFVLKDGRTSPFYLDMRVLVSHPNALARVGRALVRSAESLEFDRIAGLPYAGLPLAVAMSLIGGTPLIYPRKEAKSYGTQRLVEGEFRAGERALVVDDVITSGGAKLEAIEPLRAAGLVVEDVLVVVERGEEGARALAAAGVRLHSAIRVDVLLRHLLELGSITQEDAARAEKFVRGVA